MAYQAWSVVFGEQPSASKWNILGTNDAGFNDGTAIADDAILARHISSFDKSNLANGDSNPYKFSVYRSSAWTTANGTSAAVILNTELYDTNNNYNTADGKYTAPVNGFYFFAGSVGYSNLSSGQIPITSLAVNTTTVEKRRFQEIVAGANGNYTQSGSCVLQLTAGDYVCLLNRAAGGAGVASELATWFTGFLICRT